MRSGNITVGLLAACLVASSIQSVHGQVEESDLHQRIGELEQRVAKLERLLLAQPVTPSVAVAEARLTAAKQVFRRTELLHKEGFVSDSQIAVDKMAVVRAHTELQLAKSAQQDKAALEIDVLDAEHNLATAKQRLQQSERLRAKGFVDEIQVAADKLRVENATAHLRQAQARLATHVQSLKEDQPDDAEKNPGPAEN